MYKGYEGVIGSNRILQGVTGAKGYCYTVGDLICAKGNKGTPPPPGEREHLRAARSG